MSESWLDLSPKAVYADTGEPSAEERGQLVCRMTPTERTDFALGIARNAERYARMTDDERERFLDGLECTDG